MDHFLPTATVAEQLGIHAETLRKQLRAGSIPACCFTQTSPRAPYRINARAVTFYKQSSRWPAHRRELALVPEPVQPARPSPEPQPDDGDWRREMEAKLARLCEHVGVPMELLRG